jgi:hypothetical protein
LPVMPEASDEIEPAWRRYADSVRVVWCSMIQNIPPPPKVLHLLEGLERKEKRQQRELNHTRKIRESILADQESWESPDNVLFARRKRLLRRSGKAQIRDMIKGFCRLDTRQQLSTAFDYVYARAKDKGFHGAEIDMDKIAKACGVGLSQAKKIVETLESKMPHPGYGGEENAGVIFRLKENGKPGTRYAVVLPETKEYLGKVEEHVTL